MKTLELKDIAAALSNAIELRANWRSASQVLIASATWHLFNNNRTPIESMLAHLNNNELKQVNLFLTAYLPQWAVANQIDGDGKVIAGAFASTVRKTKTATPVVYADKTEFETTADQFANWIDLKEVKADPVKQPFKLSKEIEALIKKAKKAGRTQEASDLEMFAMGKGWISKD